MGSQIQGGGRRHVRFLYANNFGVNRHTSTKLGSIEKGSMAK